MAAQVNRKQGGSDTWLTPPELVRLLGPFDLDPCCPPKMPWKTARRMVHQPQDGLAVKWGGLVWCNPPYSEPLPWIRRMAEHREGIMLLPAKSPETRWGQELLASADLLLMLKGRLLFHYVDGTRSKGKWSPYLLAAYGKQCQARLRNITYLYPGVLLRRP